jgi:hypothetical protein
MLRSLLEVLAQKFIGWGLANSQLTCNLKHISQACKSVGLLDFLVVTLGFRLMTMSWSVRAAYPEVYEASMKLGQVDVAIYQSFFEDILLLMCKQLFLKDHGRLRQRARQSFGQVHLLNFPCDSSLCGCIFNCPWPLWTRMCAEERCTSGLRPKHAIVQYWSGLINTPPWIWKGAKMLWQICRNWLCKELEKEM